MATYPLQLPFTLQNWFGTKSRQFYLTIGGGFSATLMHLKLCDKSSLYLHWNIQ